MITIFLPSTLNPQPNALFKTAAFSVTFRHIEHGNRGVSIPRVSIPRVSIPRGHLLLGSIMYRPWKSVKASA